MEMEIVEKPTIFQFDTSDECLCLGSQVGKYLGFRNGQLYANYPGLFRRVATEEEKNALGSMGIYVKVTPFLLKASEVQDLIEGKGEPYKDSRRLVGGRQRHPRCRRMKRVNKLIPMKKFKTNSMLTNDKRYRTNGLHRKDVHITTKLITRALLQSEKGYLRSFEIIKYIERKHPFFGGNVKDWRHRIYQTLSLYPYFTKSNSSTGKGYTWQINNKYRDYLTRLAGVSQKTEQEQMSNDEDEADTVSSSAAVTDDIIFVDPNTTEENEEPVVITKSQNVKLVPNSWGRLTTVGTCGAAPFQCENDATPITKQETTHPVIDYIDLSDFDDDIEFKSEASSVFVDLTSENVDIKTKGTSVTCPLCSKTFTSNAELGAHVQIHQERESTTTRPVMDDRSVVLKQTLDNLTSCMFPNMEQKPICIFTGNNMYFNSRK